MLESICPVSEGFYHAATKVSSFFVAPSASVFPFVTYFLLDIRRTTCHWEGMLFEMTGPIFMNQGVIVFIWPGNMMQALLAMALLYVVAICLTALPKAISDVCTVLDSFFGYVCRVIARLLWFYLPKHHRSLHVAKMFIYASNAVGGVFLTIRLHTTNLTKSIKNLQLQQITMALGAFHLIRTSPLGWVLKWIILAATPLAWMYLYYKKTFLPVLKDAWLKALTDEELNQIDDEPVAVELVSESDGASGKDLAPTPDETQELHRPNNFGQRLYEQLRQRAGMGQAAQAQE